MGNAGARWSRGITVPRGEPDADQWNTGARSARCGDCALEAPANCCCSRIGRPVDRWRRGDVLRENDLATVALLVIGSIAGIVALAGVIPIRIRWRDFEIIAQAAQVDALRAEGAEEQAEEVLGATGPMGPTGPIGRLTASAESIRSYTRWTGSRASEAMAFENSVLRAIDELLPPNATLDVPHHDVGLDALIFTGRWRIGIDVRAGLAFDPDRVVRRLRENFVTFVPPVESILVVVRSDDENDPKIGRLRDAVSNLEHPVRVVAWATAAHRERLRFALAELLATPPSTQE